MLLNELEWSALQGMPHLAFRVYLSMRWRMDVSSFLVGDVVRISRRALAEECYVEPVSGRHTSKAGAPSEQQIRGALELLLSERLISRPRGPGQFVFLMDLALAGNARQKKDQPRINREEEPGQRLTPSAFAGMEQLGGGGEDQPTSEIRSKPLSVVNAAAALRAVDNSAGLLLPREIANWLRQAEKARGKIVSVSGEEPLLKSWSAGMVRAEVLVAAHAMAVADREVRENPAPINPGFLAVFVDKVKAAAVGSEPWFRSASGIEGKGRELGVVQAAGEHFPLFRLRVLAAAGVDDLEARQWQA